MYSSQTITKYLHSICVLEVQCLYCVIEINVDKLSNITYQLLFLCDIFYLLKMNRERVDASRVLKK